MDSQQNIAKRIQLGDEKAFEKLFKNTYAGMCGYAIKYLKDQDQAEEVVQDVFFNYWNKKDALTVSGSLEAYLYRSVRNACLNYLKHEKVRAHYVTVQENMIKEEQAHSGDAVVELELQHRIDECVEGLPTERRKIFRLSREEGLKYKEIAAKLGISIKTVEAQMGKALKSLRENLAEYLPSLLLLFWIGGAVCCGLLKYFTVWVRLLSELVVNL